jgi:soluble lytic murein transglycosylase-like protein
VKSKLIVDKVFRISREYSLDPMLVLAIISVESDFNEQAKSNHGAVGLMQVIPKFHREKLVGKDPMNPLVSIEVGSKILRDCMAKKDIGKALKCYNGSDTNHYTKLVLKAQFDLKQNFIRKV